MNGPLGRLEPSDRKHEEKFPLQALTPAERPVGTPVVWGIDWLSNFDVPERSSSGDWWIGRGVHGTVRGGHAIASVPGDKAYGDRQEWWRFYDQGTEGACVGFSCSRAMTWLNRRRYDARWLYHEAQRNDDWPGEDYSGTSVRAGLEILRTAGHSRWYAARSTPALPIHGILAYRWMRSVDEVLATLNNPKASRLGAIPFLNSWGERYPRVVWMPGATAQHLLDSGGECATVTDR